MKIVIDIPEKVYNALTHTEFDANLVVDEMRKAIKNGKPLPKGHGDLIDRNELLDNSYEINSIYCLYDVVVNVDDIKDAPTIIEGSEKRTCANCLLDGTDACSRGAGRAVDDSVCEDFI